MTRLGLLAVAAGRRQKRTPWRLREERKNPDGSAVQWAMEVGSISASAPELRPGTRVAVNGRLAAFLYARRNGAVIRYDGERLSRVVSLEKVEPLPALRDQ